MLMGDHETQERIHARMLEIEPTMPIGRVVNGPEPLPVPVPVPAPVAAPSQLSRQPATAHKVARGAVRDYASRRASAAEEIVSDDDDPCEQEYDDDDDDDSEYVVALFFAFA